MIIDNVDFGFAILTPTALSFLPESLKEYIPKFITVKANVGIAALVGVDKDLMTIKAQDIAVNINTFYWHLPDPTVEAIVNVAIQLFGPPTINWQTSFPTSPEDKNGNGILDIVDEDTNKNGVLDAGEDLNNNGVLDLTEDLDSNGRLARNGYALWTGGNTSVIIDFTGGIIQAKLGYVEVNLAGFVQLSGSMAFTLKNGEGVTLSNGEKTSVTSLSIGISDANGFIGVPSDVAGYSYKQGYFYDSNKDGRITSSEDKNKNGILDEGEDTNYNGVLDLGDARNHGAIGLAIENLNIGLLLATEVSFGADGIAIGVYVAAQANIDYIGLVGVDSIVLNAKSLQFDLNIGVRFKISTGYTKDPKTGAVSFQRDNAGISLLPTTIDFSQSTWMNPMLPENQDTDTTNDIIHQGYAIETGDPAKPIVLMYKNLYLRIAGQAQLAVLVGGDKIIDIHGAFEIKASTTGISIFVDVEAKIGKEGVLVFDAHALGLIVIGEYEDPNDHSVSSGIAIKFDLSSSFNIPGPDPSTPILSSEIKLQFAMNSFGKDVVYNVPEDFWATDIGGKKDGVLEYKTVVISATPPNKSRPANFYVSLMGDGSFNLMNILQLRGHIGVLFSVTDGDQVLAELSIGATVISPVLKLGAVGTLGFSNNGFYGSLNVTGLGEDNAIIEVPGVLSIGGSFLLQINTTNQDERVLELEKINGVYTGRMITPTSSQPANLPKQSFHIAGSVDVAVVSVLHLKGSVDILINQDGFQASLDVSLDLGFIGKVAVHGAAAILNTEEGPVFALKASLNVHLGIDIINLDAGATLEINTSKTHTYVEVPANTTFLLALHGADGDTAGYGSVTLLALKGTFRGEVSIVDGLFKLEIEANLKIGSLLNLSMAFKVHSDGYFYLHAGVDLDIDLAIIRLQVGASLTISSDPLFEFSVYGSLSVHLDLGFFEINETLAGFSGLIRLTAASAQLSASVTLMGMTVSGDMVWSWGRPPVIATQVGDTLYLNMGSRAQGDGNYRDTDVNYQKIKNETYSISEEKGVTTVRALGVTSTYSGVKTIIADGGDGNDCIITDPGVTSQLMFNGGTGNDVFIIAGGAATSVIHGNDDDDAITGGGAAGIHYYGDAGDDRFIGGDTAEFIDMGDGNNSVKGAGGNDVIYVGYGKNSVDAGPGDDLIYVSSTSMGGKLDLIGGDGNDKVILAPISSTGALKINNNQFIYDKRIINFDSSLEGMLITDTAARTILTTDVAGGGTLTGGGHWNNTDLSVVSSGIIDVSAVSFQLSNAHLSLVSHGLTGTVTGDMAQLTVINSGSGDIIVREANDLTIVGTGDVMVGTPHDDSMGISNVSRINGGLYASQGNIDIQLYEHESLLDLASGIINSGKVGGNIVIKADDVDFSSGPDKVSASGEFDLATNYINQGYMLGAAGNSKYGQDLSKGKDTGFMDFSMRDLDALADGFSHINIGHQNSDHTVVMYVGDIENRQMGNDVPFYNAKLTDPATITADLITVVGDVQSSDDITFIGRLAEVSKANYHDQLGPADSGVTAKTVTFNLTEQLVVTGWIIATDRINLSVKGSTGQNALVGYGSEPNGITADIGSAIYTTANNSIVTLDTTPAPGSTDSGSIIIATGLEAKGTNSSVIVKTGAGLTVLEGAVVAVREAGSTIDMTAGTYAHIDSGAAVTAGVRFEYQGDTPVPIKTGDNAGIYITSAGEMRLSGSITSSGAMELKGGGSSGGYADYFDTINGQTITKITDAGQMAVVIDALNSGTVNSAIISALTDSKYTLGAGATASSIANYTPFASLSDAQKLIVATSLGYVMMPVQNSDNLIAPPAYYYNPAAPAGKQLVSTFTEGGYAGSLAGYTYYGGTVYYNPTTKAIKTSFVQGDPVDYDNNLINWGDVGAPAAGTSFDNLTEAQKAVVVAALGYTKDTPAPEFQRTDFVDASLKNFCNALHTDVGAIFSVDTSTAIKESDPGYVALTDAQTGTLVGEINGLLLQTDLYSKLSIKFPAQAPTAGLLALQAKYDASLREVDLKNFNRAVLNEYLPTYTPKLPINTGTYFNYNAPLGKKTVTTFVQGTWADYKSSDVYWGDPAKSGDMTILAHALGYDVYSNAYINPTVTNGKDVITALAAPGTSPDYRLEDIDWGGVAAPAADTSFESLTVAQKNVVLSSTGYSVYKGTLYYNSDSKTVSPTVAYTISQVTWDVTTTSVDAVSGKSVTAKKNYQPADGTPFEKLSPLQQGLVLTATKTRIFTGTAYYNSQAPSAKQFVTTLIEGTDYHNNTLTWSTVEVPASGALFADMTDAEKAARPSMTADQQKVLDAKYLTAAQKNAIINSLGYEKYTQTVYYKAGAPVESALVTKFTEGIDYHNAAMSWGSAQAVKTTRWVITDGTNSYLVYAMDADNNGTVDEVQIQQTYELLGQRGFGFLLNGTITSLKDNNRMVIASAGDTIIRGNINLLGANSDLTIQSDTWTYFEGVANVTEDFTLLGGVSLGGVSSAGVPLGGTVTLNAKETSVYIQATATVNTQEAGSVITIMGGKDVDIHGRVVAGGSIGPNGIVWAGNGVNDSEVLITAGQQVAIDTAVAASKKVSITTLSSTGVDDAGIGLLLTAASGLTTAGLTSDGSGGLVKIDTVGDISFMGMILSGGSVTQTFDEVGNLQAETFAWNPQKSRVDIATDGQLWLGGMSRTINGTMVEIGGVIRASEEIRLAGGTSADGRGIRMPGSAKVAVSNPNGSIYLTSVNDAEVNGVLVAGGDVIDHRDPAGKYLGSTVQTYGGDSTISIQSGQQIRLGRDLYAGKIIDLRGGIDPINLSETFSGQGIVLGGTTHLATWQKNSTINLSAEGDLSILAPAWTQELIADGFGQYADGHITSDVTLKLGFSKGSGLVNYDIVVTAASTANNTGLAGLRDDLQAAIDRALGKDPTTGESYLTARLTDGRLMLTSWYNFDLQKLGTVNGALLGFTQLATADVSSGRMRAVDAGAAGSVVNIGKDGSYNGKIYIGGWIRGSKSINLYSGIKSDGSQDFTLDVTGTLETMEGSIVLNPGDNGVVLGDLIARGAGSDVVINSKDTLELRGDILAQNNIIITAGTSLVNGEISIYTHGTSHFSTIDPGGVISITGKNNVNINSAIGFTWDANMQPVLGSQRQISITSTDGTLWVVGKEYPPIKEYAPLLDSLGNAVVDSNGKQILSSVATPIKGAGNIETAGELILTGKNVDIEGVVRSTRITPAAYDNEVTVNASANVTIHGNLTMAGSLLVSAGGDVSIHNTILDAGSGQRITVNTLGNLLLGDVGLAASATNPMAAIISADRLVEFNVGKELIVAADALVFSKGTSSRVNVIANGSVSIIGSVRAGATYSASSPGYSWSGANGTVSITSDTDVVIGGEGLDSSTYAKIAFGGTISASGSVLIATGKDSSGVGLTLSDKSSIVVDATGAGAFAATATGLLKIAAVGDISLLGIIEAIDGGADVSITSESLVFVNGFVKANDELTITGGVDASGIGILVTPVVFASDNVTRVSGGTLDTAAGGKMHLSATDSIYLQGVIGQMAGSNPNYVAHVSALDVTSTTSLVSVSGSVDVDGSVTVKAKDISVFEGGRIFARGTNSTMLLNATGTVYLAPDSNPVVNPPSAAILRANALLHILSGTIRIDGIVENVIGSSGRILLNSVTATTITGAITSHGNIEINSGVSLGWSLGVLAAPISRSNLSGGSITISQSGTLNADDTANLKAGGDVVINADTSGGGTAPVVIPVITTGTKYVDVITGYTQVYAGTHTVNDVTITKTLITEQTGTEQVVVGHNNYRMDVSLEEVGYYNPNAPDGAKFREVLVEGIDYFNSTIDWAKAGNEALPSRTASVVTGDYKNAAYREFQALNDAQKQAVLNCTGYMPLYQFSYSWGGVSGKVQLEQTINGTPSNLTVTPLWAANAEKVYRIDVAGWRDKYVMMPEGANQDILNVVSQGEARYLSGDTSADGSNSGGSWVSATAAGVIYSKGATTRTEFIPGSDYQNNATFWTTYGAVAPASDATWTGLSAAQQNAVATFLGYTATFNATKGEYIGTYQDYSNIDYTQDKSRFNNTATTLTEETTLTGKNMYSGATSTDQSALAAMWNSKTASSDTDTTDARWAVTYNNDTIHNTAAYSSAVEGIGTRSTNNVDGTGYRVYSIPNTLTAIGQSTSRVTDRNRDPNWEWTTSGNIAVDDPRTATPSASSSTRYTDNIYVDGVLKSDLSNNTQSLVQVDASTRKVKNVGSFELWTDMYGYGSDDFNNDGWNSDPDESDLKRGGWQVYTDSWRDTVDWHRHFGSGSTAPIEQINDNHRMSIDGHLESTWTGDQYHTIDWAWQDKYKVTVDETQHDYTYAWTSNSHDIFDTRVKLSYQLVTQSKDIYDYRPVYATTEKTIVTLTPRDVSDWNTVPVIVQQAELWTTQGTDTSSTLGAYGGDSVHANSISIEAGKNSTISGRVISTGSLSATAVDTLTVKGATRSTTSNNVTTTTTMLSYLEAKDSINLNAGSNLNLTASSRVKTTDADTSSDVTLTSKQMMSLAGFVEAGDTISAAAARDLTLGGTITAGTAVSITAGDAGQGTVKDGSIKSGSYLDLKVTGVSGTITLTAGSVGGDIALTNNALITSPASVTMTAASGRVSHADGFITATTLTVDAADGFSAVTTVTNLDIAISDVGNVDISSSTSVNLADISTTDGSITVKALGDITATKVHALGTSDRNDITLTAIKTTTPVTTGSITLVDVAANGLGDVSLTAQGSISQNSGVVVADNLSVSIMGGVTLKTNVSSLSIETKAIGDVTVTQSTSKDLVVSSALVMNGKFTLTTAGALDLAEVILASNSDANDIVVTAAGNIGVRHIVAGIYASSDSDFGTATGSGGAAITSVSSLGDIFLTSTSGLIQETFPDAAVDVVADTLSLSASSGILGLEIAVNTITTATTTTGDIWLRDFDGFKEKSNGLTVGTVTTVKDNTSTVTIESQNNLFMGAASLVQGGTIKLISDSANIQVLAPTAGVGANSLSYSNGISFNAAHVIDLYKFFANAPDLTEYRAGDYFQFGTGDTRTKLIPESNITSKSIILQTGASISINGTLTATDYLELNSARDVVVKGDIVGSNGNIGKVVIIAQGTGASDATTVSQVINGVYQPVTVADTGYINIQTTGIDASNFEIRALRDISINLLDDLTISGYIGGVTGFDKAHNISIQLVSKDHINPATGLTETGWFDHVAKTLTVTGGIVAASNNMLLQAGTIASDSSSVFIATDLNALANNSILLNTLVDTLTAVSTVSGNVMVNEADALTVNKISAYNGAVDITTGGDLTAINVVTVKDNVNNNITINSGKDISIGYLEAGTASGAQKLSAKVVVDAAGVIKEIADPTTVTVNGTVIPVVDAVDVFAYNITLRDSSGHPAYVVIHNPTDIGSSSALEVAYTMIGSNGVTTDATTNNQGSAVSSGGGVVAATCTTTTPAGTSSKQTSSITFASNVLDTDLTTSPVYCYTVTVNSTAYVVVAGDNGVTNTWASILGAFKSSIEAAQVNGVGVNVTVDSVQRKLNLESSVANTSFTVGTVKVERIDSGDVADGVSQPESIIQVAGIPIKQVSDVTFTSAALASDSIFTVLVNDHNYATRIGDNEIINVTGGALTSSTPIYLSAEQPQAIAGVSGVALNTRKTIDFSGVDVVVGGVYSVTIGTDVFSYQAQLADTLPTIVAGLVTAINGTTYTASAGGSTTLTLSSGVTNSTITVDGTSNSTTIPGISGVTITTYRTINFTGVSAVSGGAYSVTIGSDVYNYTAQSSDALQDIVTHLATAINGTTYTASAGGTTTITISSGAADKTITVNGTQLVPVTGAGQVVIGDTTEAGRSINLSGLAAVNGGIYKVTIGGTSYTYTAGSGATLTSIATGLASSIGAAYTATVHSATVTLDWSSVLTELKGRIEAGEAVTGTVTPATYDLSLQANVANTSFTVDGVGVTSSTSVLNSGSNPTVTAASNVAQKSQVAFGNLSLSPNSNVFQTFTVALDGTSVVVSSGTQETLSVGTTQTAASATDAQVSYLTYVTLSTSYSYTVTVGNNTYTARSTSTTDWTPLLTALQSQISTYETAVTATIDVANKRIVLTAKTVNTAFTASGSEIHATFVAKTWDTVLNDLKKGLETMPAATSTQTVAAATSTAQVSELIYDVGGIATGYTYSLSVNATVYTVTVGQGGVTASLSSILNTFVSLIAADSSKVVVAVADAATNKLTLTALSNNSPFVCDSSFSKVSVEVDAANKLLTITSKATNTPFSIGMVSVTPTNFIAKNGTFPSTSPGYSQKQITDVVFNATVPVLVGYSYSVTISSGGTAHTYSALVDGTLVPATITGVLTKLKTLIDAGATTADIDITNFRLTLTADASDTPFSVTSVTLTQDITSQIANGITATAPQGGGTTAKQNSTVTFGGSANSNYQYKVTVNGVTVTATGSSWSNILGSLQTSLTNGGVVTVPSIDTSTGALTLTAVANNTPFTFTALAVNSNAGSGLTYAGDKVLVLLDRTGGVFGATSTTGTLTVVNLPTFDHDVISLTANKDLVVVSPISVGDGTVALTAGGGLTLGDRVTASTLSLTAGTAGIKDDVSITTVVQNLTVDMKGTGNFTVIQPGDASHYNPLTIGSLNMTGGNLSIEAYGDIVITSLSGTMGTVTITSKYGKVTILNNSSNAGAVTLSAATTVTATLEADTLDISAGGAIDIHEADGVTINSIVSSSNAAISVVSGGQLTVNGAITTTSGNTVTLTTTSGAINLNQTITTATGEVRISAANGLNLSAQADITSTLGNVTLNGGSGGLTMTGDTVVNAGSGVISLVAAGDITVGKLHTTSTSDLTITTTGGAVYDAGDGVPDITATEARLVISSANGVGFNFGTHLYGALETQVATLQVINSNASSTGAVAIEDVDSLTIEKVYQSGSGAVSIATIDGPLVVTSTYANGVTATVGTVTLYAGGQTSSRFDLNSYIRTTGGGVSITTDSGDITMTKGIEVLGTGNITMLAPLGSVLNTPSAAGWLQTSSSYNSATNSYVGTDFSKQIDWAMTNSRFVVDVATGQITVANESASPESSSIST